MGADPLMILCVDDDIDSCAAMERLLSSSGCVTLSAHNCDDALRTARVARFDVLLADAGLPDGNGLDLLKQIRAIYPITGIALTGYSGLEHQARQAGFGACLLKPIDFRALSIEIGRACGFHSADTADPAAVAPSAI